MGYLLTYYAHIFNDTKHDIRKTRKIIHSTIGKLNVKTATPQTFKIDNTNISYHSIITSNFCEFITKIGVKYANNITPSVRNAHNYFNLMQTPCF